MKFSGKVDSGPLDNRLDFGGDPHHRLDTGIVFFPDSILLRDSESWTVL